MVVQSEVSDLVECGRILNRFQIFCPQTQTVEIRQIVENSPQPETIFDSNSEVFWNERKETMDLDHKLERSFKIVNCAINGYVSNY
jgi:hypothetical protein